MLLLLEEALGALAWAVFVICCSAVGCGWRGIAFVVWIIELFQVTTCCTSTLKVADGLTLGKCWFGSRSSVERATTRAWLLPLPVTTSCLLATITVPACWPLAAGTTKYKCSNNCMAVGCLFQSP